MFASFKKFAALLAVASLSTEVAAHYRFTKLVANGATTAEFQYVRTFTNSNSPVTDVRSNDFRCNVGGLASGGRTQTASVAAGSQIGFAMDSSVTHPGVLNMYLGKVPSGQTAATWDGSGANWFKVYQVSAVTNGGTSITWPTDSKSTFTFTLPRSTPSGEYLLRVEHIALHSASTFGGAQFYISCAQINVTGGGSGNPGKVSIPGVYTGNESGILLNIYWPIPTSYSQPGPSVWSG